jgi:aspartate aminotransferase
VLPKGAFYAFANVSGLFGRRVPASEGAPARILSGSADVTEFLLTHALVAVVPGVDFGSDAHVRLSYATSTELIRDGLDRMGSALKLLT